MEINWSIAGWIIAILVFYTIGFYEGRGNGYKRRKREEEQEKLKTPPAPPVKVDDPGLLRIKNENGNITLDLDGARVDTSALSPDQRKRLMEVVMLTRPWLKEETANAPMMTTPPLPPQPVSAPPQPAASTLPPIRPMTVTESSTEKEDRPSAPANSIVGQIDSILQARIAGTPLEQRRVFLSQSPEGGVIVHVGFDKYFGVEDVPDIEIKSALRAAIAEWEKKYTPGL
ncbi:MAG: hypothetical protein AB1607_14925 [Chloroflexota bacterium]